MIVKEHLSKYDREIAAIRALLKAGMSLLNRNQQQISQLIAAQKRTEAALKAFIESREASNGHSKRKIDLQ
jgi:septal ring factor EnvC (AmiA/AmiB activator)